MWWWLSFADPVKPYGAQFLGVVIVQAGDFKKAMEVATRLGLNPGGECAGWKMNEAPAEVHRNRLLTLDVVQELGNPVVRQGASMRPGPSRAVGEA